MAVASTLAYYDAATVMTIKSFIVQALESFCRIYFEMKDAQATNLK
jgi:hypothetical protein